MKADRPSRTARFVTLGRALADAGLSHIPDFRDPTARVFLSDKGKQTLAKAERAAREGKNRVRVEMTRGYADIMGLRTVVIDAAIRDALARGARQLVILGAGFDGRAWRMRELEGVKVFEVDHPATQGDKRALVTALPPAVGIVSFVPVDFANDSLDAALERAGHDRSVPTCWIWEGVVMYLTRDAVHATLGAIAGRSAPDSTLIVNYHNIHRRLLMRLVLRWIGEPQLSAWTPDEMAADLRAAGLVVSEDSGVVDWNERFAQGKGRVARAKYMRVAVARI